MNKQPEQLRDILCDFMEQIEEIGSGIVGSPTEDDLAKIDAVYQNATDRVEAQLAERERLGRFEENRDLRINITDIRFKAQLDGKIGDINGIDHCINALDNRYKILNEVEK